MNSFKIAFSSIKNIINRPTTYIQSSLMLQLIKLIITLPLLSYLFFSILALSEAEGLTDTNLKSLFASPTALALLSLFLFIFIFFIYFELGFFFVLAYHQRLNQHIFFKSIVFKLFKKTKYFLSFHTLFFLLYFAIILPIASIGLDSSLTEQIKIPEFITDELMLMKGGKIVFFLFIGVLFFISVRSIFTIVYFVIEPELSILDALKKSWRETKGQFFHITLTLGSIVLLFSLTTLITAALIFLPLTAFESYFSVGLPFVAGITLTLLQIFIFIFGALLQPTFSDATLMLAYPKLQNTQVIAEARPSILKWIRERKKLSALSFILLLAFISFNGLSLNETIYQPTTQVIAHRGNVEVALENSIEALQAAADVKADYVEMDIQETKDQDFVVYHDASLRRLANRSGVISEMTLDELEGIPIESQGFKSKIPSFSDYIDIAIKEDIKLLVEIKLHGNESENFAKNFVNLLEEKEVTESYIVQSLDYDILMEIKALNPKIKTSYVSALNIGKLPKTETEFIGLEEFSINKKVLDQAAHADLQIMIWTVNKEELLHKYIRQDAAAIITNYPKMAVEIRDSYNEEKTFAERIKFILNLE